MNPEKTLLFCFETGGRSFAFEVLDLLLVCRVLAITPLEGAADFFEGLVNLRGEVTPVLNLSMRLSLPAQEIGQQTRLVTVKTSAGNLSVKVDRVKGVLTVSSDSLTDAPSSTCDRFFKQVYKEPDLMIPVLNPDELLNLEELKRLRQSKVAPSLWITPSDISEAHSVPEIF